MLLSHIGSGRRAPLIFNLALDEGDWQASHLCSLNSGEKPPLLSEQEDSQALVNE